MARNINQKLGLSRGRSVLGSKTWDELVTLSNTTSSTSIPKEFISEGVTAWNQDTGRYMTYVSQSSGFAAAGSQGGIFTDSRDVRMGNGSAGTPGFKYQIVRPGTNIDMVAFGATAATDNEIVIGVAKNNASGSGGPIAIQLHGKVDIRTSGTVNVGDFMELSTVQSSGSSNGTAGGIGTFGWALTSGSAGDIVTVFFRGAESN